MHSKTEKVLKKILEIALLSKIENYKAETEHKPFFNAIFSKEQVVSASIIHSFYTTFGMSIYEQMAVEMARGQGHFAVRQYKLQGSVDKKTSVLISNIHHELRKGKPADSISETNAIKKSILKGEANKDPDSIVDLYVKTNSGVEYFFDIISVKPNMKEFVALKLKLLRWKALRLSQDKEAKVVTALAIPYNPYYPRPYLRWTARTIFDKNELIVGEQFWDFVGGKGAYKDLLKLFSEIGKKMRNKIRKAV